MTQLTPIEIAILKGLLTAAEGESKELERIVRHFSATSLALILSALAKIDAAVRAELAAESSEANDETN